MVLSGAQRMAYQIRLVDRLLPVVSPHDGGKLMSGCVDCDRLRETRLRLSELDREAREGNP